MQLLCFFPPQFTECPVTDLICDPLLPDMLGKAQRIFFWGGGGICTCMYERCSEMWHLKRSLVWLLADLRIFWSGSQRRHFFCLRPVDISRLFIVIIKSLVSFLLSTKNSQPSCVCCVPFCGKRLLVFTIIE